MSEDMSQAMCELLYCQGDVFKGLKKKKSTQKESYQPLPQDIAFVLRTFKANIF